MRDTHRRARAIQQGRMQCFQPQPTGHRERHRTTLVALICGVVGGQRAQLSAIADHAPRGDADQERVMARVRRWRKHDAQTVDGWFLPVVGAAHASGPRRSHLACIHARDDHTRECECQMGSYRF